MQIVKPFIAQCLGFPFMSELLNKTCARGAVRRQLLNLANLIQQNSPSVEEQNEAGRMAYRISSDIPQPFFDEGCPIHPAGCPA